MNMMKRMATVVLLAFTSASWADLEPFDDYDISDAVWSVTTVKVNSNGTRSATSEFIYRGLIYRSHKSDTNLMVGHWRDDLSVSGSIYLQGSEKLLCRKTIVFLLDMNRLDGDSIGHFAVP